MLKINVLKQLINECFIIREERPTLTVHNKAERVTAVTQPPMHDSGVSKTDYTMTHHKMHLKQCTALTRADYSVHSNIYYLVPFSMLILTQGDFIINTMTRCLKTV